MSVYQQTGFGPDHQRDRHRLAVTLQFLVAIPPFDLGERTEADKRDIRWPEDAIQEGRPFQVGGYGADIITQGMIARSIANAAVPGEYVYLDIPMTSEEDAHLLEEYTDAAGIWGTDSRTRLYWYDHEGPKSGFLEGELPCEWRVKVSDEFSKRFNEDEEGSKNRTGPWRWTPVEVRTPYYPAREIDKLQLCLAWMTTEIRNDFRVCFGNSCYTIFSLLEERRGIPLQWPILHRIVSGMYLMEQAMLSFIHPSRKQHDSPFPPLFRNSRLALNPDELRVGHIIEHIDWLPYLQSIPLPTHRDYKLIQALHIIAAHWGNYWLGYLLSGEDETPSAIYRNECGQFCIQYLEGTFDVPTLQLWVGVIMKIMVCAGDAEKFARFLRRVLYAERAFHPSNMASVDALFHHFKTNDCDVYLPELWRPAKVHTMRGPIDQEGILETAEAVGPPASSAEPGIWEGLLRTARDSGPSVDTDVIMDRTTLISWDRPPINNMDFIILFVIPNYEEEEEEEEDKKKLELLMRLSISALMRRPNGMYPFAPK
ncbi:hypothetical protein VHEMI00307 [[Torrubiella] hemipterigena]|uniref:Uncharacterized protein n=1 Tax=[Torrubiella] hemipterigena TaxID=1531966 RepID=A0A0A1T1K2_9HYPO|nr:hypothetical protein VHEMI00307 [[Torrubiella] hemipterigena]